MMVMQKPIKATSTTVVFVAGSDIIAYKNKDGKRKSVNPDQKIKEMSLETAKVLQTDFCSVIFIDTTKGPVISKVLLYPNFEIFKQVGCHEPAVKMVSAIGEKIEEKELSVEEVVGKITKGFTDIVRWIGREIGNIGSSK